MIQSEQQEIVIQNSDIQGSEDNDKLKKKTKQNKEVRSDIEVSDDSSSDIKNAIEEKKPPKFDWCNEILVACGLGFTSYIGTLIRIGFSYYKVWKIDVNYSIMYAQIIGCLLMGIFTEFQKYSIESKAKIDKVLYITFTTGLCGSITTFSSWQYESNKNFFMQWDLSFEDSYGSYNGGKIFEWVISQLELTAICYMVFKCGQHIGQLSKYSNSRLKAEYVNSRYWQNKLKEITVILMFIISTAVVITIPLIYDNYIHMMFSCIFGFCGTYTRYLLSLFLNPKLNQFHLGTFTANIAGSWLLAMLIVLAKFVVPYSDQIRMSIIFGLIQGFCGCLSTVSTYINELNKLQIKWKYVYGISSNVVAQFGFIMIFNIYARTQIPQSEIQPVKINLCQSYDQLCDNLLTMVNCPDSSMIKLSCSDFSDYSTFVGKCSCGNFKVGDRRISELITDGQSKDYTYNLMTWVWPNNAHDVQYPTKTFDYCITYQKACSQFMYRINCESDKKRIIGCKQKGINNFQGICECGSYDVSNDRIQEIIVDTSLQKRYDLIPYNGYITLNKVNMCDAYDRVCKNMLDYIQCPSYRRKIDSCQNNQDYQTWVGMCSCGDNLDIMSVRVAKDILDAFVRPNAIQQMVGASSSVALPARINSFDICESYTNLCQFTLDKIDCPNEIRNIQNCENGLIQNYVGLCQCGHFNITSIRIGEIIVDTILFEEVYNNYTYLAPPIPPYYDLIQSNPFGPFFSN